MGKPVGYLVDGCLDAEPNLRMLMEARAEVGGNTLAGIACDRKDPDREIDQLAGTLCYAATENFQRPKNFYGVGGMKIFRDLIWQMRGLMRAITLEDILTACRRADADAGIIDYCI